MENDTLSILSNVLAIVLTFAASAGGSYLIYRGKLEDVRTSEKIASINQQDDMLTAYGNLQSQLANAAKNLIEPLNLQIAEQLKRLELSDEQLRQLRDYVRLKSDEIDALTVRVKALEMENQDLKAQLETSRRRENSLQQRLNRIRHDLGTGELPSAPHDIPKKDDE